MDVEIGGPAEALNDGGTPAAGVPQSARARPGPQVPLHGPHEDADHRPTQVVTPCHQIPHAVREAQHPLPYGDTLATAQ